MISAISPKSRENVCGGNGMNVLPYANPQLFNSLTAKSCYGGEKHRNPVGFYSRNSTKSTLQHKHNYHKHHHHGGAVCPSFGVGSMDPPDRTRVTSSKGVERGGWCKRFN
jgi:hypothetical protein